MIALLDTFEPLTQKFRVYPHSQQSKIGEALSARGVKGQAGQFNSFVADYTDIAIFVRGVEREVSKSEVAYFKEWP